MSSRLEKGGILINRDKTVEFSFDGKRMFGFNGDTLASALMANGQTTVGRSFKYHRPRGLVASGSEEPNGLVSTGETNSFEPNQKATTVELFDNLKATSQNCWPSLGFDIGSVSSLIAKFIPAGFYYKTFIHPKPAWKHLFEPMIRRAAGLGNPPRHPDLDRYEHFYCHTDVLVIGGGLTGLTCAQQAGMSGAKTLLIEQAPVFGGRMLSDTDDISGITPQSWVQGKCKELESLSNVRLKLRTVASGVFDHGFVLAYERIADHTPGDGRPRHRLWKIRAKKVILAAGSLERPLVFAGNDVPGVMLASAVRDYLKLYGVSPGDRTVIVTNNDNAYRTAIELNSAGLSVPAIIDLRDQVGGELVDRVRELNIPLRVGKGVRGVVGKKSINSIEICSQNGEGTLEDTIQCDCIAMSGGWSPLVHLWSHCGGKLVWDEKNGIFIPDTKRPPRDDEGVSFMLPAGSATGKFMSADCQDSGIKSALDAVESLGFRVKKIKSEKIADEDEKKSQPIWVTPNASTQKLQEKMFVDFQNDVKVADIKLSVLEGYESVEHVKRYTTLGMATDQGKLSNLNGLKILADTIGRRVDEVGTTTFRPPFTPISMGSIAGEATGHLFKATRKTAIDEWNSANGGQWEQVGDWRRVYAYLRSGETVREAVNREVLNTRKRVGLLDASTLGKILVSGPDAGAFLDLIYTNTMSNMKVGKCRYGLMCNENGFLFDDGVVVRLSESTFLCHTTTGGSDRVYSWMEEWLQTEWWTLNVFTFNLTEQYAQIGIAGPKAKQLLETVLDKEGAVSDLSFMSFMRTKYKNVGLNIFRISFSGELSYEVAVPTKHALTFWNDCIKLGEKFGIQPYGTEALHVMRAEKGFIMIGDETDGTVIPQDLNLNWAVSKKKKDFLGKRAHSRVYMRAEDRKQLVGLLTDNPAFVLPDGAHAIEKSEERASANIIGHVTSSYFSPTLGRSIALGLISGGADRLGEKLDFSLDDGNVERAKIVKPVFYDPTGEKQNE